MSITPQQLQRLSTLCAQPEADMTFDDTLDFLERSGVPVDMYLDCVEWAHKVVRLLGEHSDRLGALVREEERPGVSVEFTIWLRLAHAMATAMAGHAHRAKINDLGAIQRMSRNMGAVFADTFLQMMTGYLERPFMKDITPHTPTSNTRN